MATSTSTKKRKTLVGREGKQELWNYLSQATDPRKAVLEFQKKHSLHVFLAKAFGTTPIHEQRITRGNISERESKARDGIIPETFQPESILTFLGHLGVTRHDVHKKISDALRTALEEEIEGVDIRSSSSIGKKNRDSLLELLAETWELRQVHDLRPVVIALVKKLGDQTPVKVLSLLAKKDELLQQFGLNMKQLVWEADWTSVVRDDGTPVDASTDIANVGTLHCGNILAADMVKPVVKEYLSDEALRYGAQLMFPATNREKKFSTQSRRNVIRDFVDNGKTGSTSTSVFGAISSSTSGLSRSCGNFNTWGQPVTSCLDSSTLQKEIKTSSGIALARIKEIMGSRPKLLAAILNMLIAEHGRKLEMNVINPVESVDEGSLEDESNMICTLVADILLSYGQLPRAYEQVSILAKLLDDAVKIGLISNQAIAQIQGCLRVIFQPAQEKEKTAKDLSTDNALLKGQKSAIAPKKQRSSESDTAEHQFKLKLLRKIVEEAVVGMKDSDPQGLFLNTVTDQIAPRYSMVIKTPICIRDIEKKAVNLEYSSLNEYKSDVELMFKNCIMYNIGIAGKWFRDEAQRQQNIWKSEIWSRANHIHEFEMKERKEKLKKAAKTSGGVGCNPTSTKENNEKKRKLEIISRQKEHRSKLGREKKTRKLNTTTKNCDDAITKLGADDIDPLLASRLKKRKKDFDFPSMPAIAAMLLSDPFVVRLLLDKILRAARDDVLKDQTIPICHHTIPSVFQLLHLSQLSVKLCAIKGKIYMIPDVGLSVSMKRDDEGGVEDQSLNAPFETLRKFTPLFTKILLELELDCRMSVGGDLHNVSSPRPPVNIIEWKGVPFRLLLCLLQGALVHILQPGKSHENSLSSQISRLVAAIDLFSGGNMRNERQFFYSLSFALLKHKEKLSHTVRDLIITSWLKWFKAPDCLSCMASAVHECLMHLLTEWSLLGNRIMPRDKLLSLAEEIAKAAEVSSHDKSITFAHHWVRNEKTFFAVKSYYERMLKSIPVEARAKQWKESMGIDDNNLQIIGTKFKEKDTDT